MLVYLIHSKFPVAVVIHDIHLNSLTASWSNKFPDNIFVSPCSLLRKLACTLHRVMLRVRMYPDSILDPMHVVPFSPCFLHLVPSWCLINDDSNFSIQRKRERKYINSISYLVEHVKVIKERASNVLCAYSQICVTTSTSAGLDQILPWMFYHKVIGVTTFFLFVEGKAAAPGVSKVLESIPVC